MSLNFRSTAAAFAFALVLVTTTAAQALPLSFQARGGESVLTIAWEWLTSRFVSASKAGGMMDPDGNKAGGMMDPNGLTTEAGPNGFGLDAGGMMDPDGLR